MNPQLPPLPAPDWTQNYAHSDAAMTAYGLQCAEAERARCLEELNGMLNTVKMAPPHLLLSDCRAYAEKLLSYLVNRIEKK